MDGVLCDFFGAAKRALLENPEIKYPQATYGFFTGLPEKEGAVAAFHWLFEHYDTWVLTRPSIKNPLCYTEKRVWVEQHLGYAACEKLILAPDKAMWTGDYLIDDNPWPGFKGTRIAFGSSDYPNWEKTLEFFRMMKLDLEMKKMDLDNQARYPER